MNFKRRGERISLYRSIWVPRGPGVSHGHTRQTFVGSLHSNAASIPPELAELLSPDERALVERRIIAPALAAQEATIQRAQRLEADPIWRLEKAHQLVKEAAELSRTSAVAAARTELLRAAVDTVKTAGDTSPRTSVVAADPLRDALSAVTAAAQAVHRGQYGRGPQSGFRKTAVFRRWTEILAAVDGSESSLLRALQNAGFASRRKN